MGWINASREKKELCCDPVCVDSIMTMEIFVCPLSESDMLEDRVHVFSL